MLLLMSMPLIVDRDMPYPGFTALPTILASLILLAPSEPDGVLGFLSNPVLVYVGRLSYSWYLWHWFVFAAANTLGYFTPEYVPALIVLSFAFAALSYHTVESRFRRRRWIPNDRVFVPGMVVTSALLVSVTATLPIAERFLRAPTSDLHERILSYEANWKDSDEFVNSYRHGTCFLEPGMEADQLIRQCYEPGPGLNIALLGDSNAAHLAPGLRAHFPNARVLQVTGSSCRPTVPGRNTAPAPCGHLNEVTFETVLRSRAIDLFIISARWEPTDLTQGAIDGLMQLLGRLEIADRVILIGRQTYFSDNVALHAARAIRGSDLEALDLDHLQASLNASLHPLEDLSELDSRMRQAVEDTGVLYVSAYEFQMLTDGTFEFINENGELRYWDSGHLTDVGSVSTVNRILSFEPVKRRVREALYARD